MTAMPTEAPDAPVPGLQWASFVYRPHAPVMGVQLAADPTDYCEAPLHSLAVASQVPFVAALHASMAPPAAWIEMLWFPDTSIVVRCWKTCDRCHVAMARTAGRVSRPR